ncbi:MAG: hypothetical protein DWQ35_16045 [Planctomycetota bacterium]|nr:MAG: hypothetical protein DWQ35_16045 [Planctomycetota bacterium]REK18256.1 MAG: hypothetical protein DWQ42_20470 [Planctomycetota bacterium]REK49126.1 MAG: hypothetical protein DWQ46_01070 [Planctomycetota bacterium]
MDHIHKDIDMNKLLQTFLDRLRDRIVASVASVVGSTFSAFRLAQEAEQQSYLEDLARQYEADGKSQLAEQIRCRAKTLSMDDPTAEAQPVIQNLLADCRTLPALQSSPASPDDDAEGGRALNPTPKTRRKSKSRKTTDDSSISLD